MFEFSIYAVIVQLVGLLALTVCVSRYFRDDIQFVYKASMGSNALYGLQLALLLNPIGAAVCALGFLRSFVYAVPFLAQYKSKLIPVIVALLLACGFMFKEAGVVSLVVLLPLITYYAEYKGCTKLYRKSCVIAAAGWIMFAAYAGSLGLFVSSSINLGFCLVAILRFDYPQIGLALGLTRLAKQKVKSK